MRSPGGIDNTPRTRRLVQVVSDLRRHDFAGCRIMDLGCAHGALALEFARRGAQSVGLEGRERWIETANGLKRSLRIENVEFVQGDVRDFSRERFGTFDVVICAGLLYHLDAPQVFELVERIGEACTDFALFDTHVALHPKKEVEWRGRSYRGLAYQEHHPGVSEEQKIAAEGASLDNDWSFWLTKPSLLNLLRDVGFTSVLEVHNPIGNVYEDGEMRFHPDQVALIAMKGQGIGRFISGGSATIDRVEDWPEDLRPHHLVRPHAQFQTPDEPAAKAPWWSFKRRK